MSNSHGPRKGTRRALRRNVRSRGRISISKFVQNFNQGDKVVINPEPSFQKNIPFRRFFGRAGIIESKRGKSYVVSIKEGNSNKKVICRPVHLRGA